MTYELAKSLKDAGFPQEGQIIHDPQCTRRNDCGTTAKYCSYQPTLSELIEACGEDFKSLERIGRTWVVVGGWNGQKWALVGLGTTPEEAVARLWLALNTPADSG